MKLIPARVKIPSCGAAPARSERKFGILNNLYYHAIRYLSLKNKNNNMTEIEKIHSSTGKTLYDMVNTIKGIYKDGVIKPLEELRIKDNTEVIIIFSDEDKTKKSALASAAGTWK